MNCLSQPRPECIVAALVDWIQGARRDLPWRRQRDAYAVWVSEVMLQQTQAATVVPYFERWMVRFPDIQSLAAASLSEVLKSWEGLGYYARARNMHSAAVEVVERHGGNLPKNREGLLSLTGIGPYTAGAILSLAYGQPEPVLEGNVRRVLCRLYDIADNPRRAMTERRLWDLARALVQHAPAGQAGDLNESLMELGALVCTARTPQCAACPLSAVCLARAFGVEGSRPARAATRHVPHYTVAAAVVEDITRRYLVIQRRAEGLLGGLWGFPFTVVDPHQSPEAFTAPAMHALLSIDVVVSERLAVIRHAYSHFRITLHAFRCTCVGGSPASSEYAAWRWVANAEMAQYPMPVADQKIAKALAAHLEEL